MSGQKENYCLDAAYVHTNCKILRALHDIYSLLSACVRKIFLEGGGSAVNIVSTYRSQPLVLTNSL